MTNSMKKMEEGKRSRRRVLVVEDEPSLRNLLDKFLSEHACCVVAVTDGRSALKYLNSGRAAPDLILTDVSLPGMDGYDLVREVKRRHPEIMVVILSGLVEETVRRNADPQPDAILKKPITLRELGDVVFGMLGMEGGDSGVKRSGEGV